MSGRISRLPGGKARQRDELGIWNAAAFWGRQKAVVDCEKESENFGGSLNVSFLLDAASGLLQDCNRTRTNLRLMISLSPVSKAPISSSRTNDNMSEAYERGSPFLRAESPTAVIFAFSFCVSLSRLRCSWDKPRSHSSMMCRSDFANYSARRSRYLRACKGRTRRSCLLLGHRVLGKSVAKRNVLNPYQSEEIEPGYERPRLDQHETANRTLAPDSTAARTACRAGGSRRLRLVEGLRLVRAASRRRAALPTPLERCRPPPLVL